jgi:hypothetical protein
MEHKDGRRAVDATGLPARCAKRGDAMTMKPGATDTSTTEAARARDVYERWTRDLRDARASLPADADHEMIVAAAAARWRDREPPELAWVPGELRRILREERHDNTGADFLDRVIRGDATALRRADGAIVYLPPDLVAAMTDAERAAYEPYDPLLARALHAHALSGEIEAADAERAE